MRGLCHCCYSSNEQLHVHRGKISCDECHKNNLTIQ